jgi:hypothetical protein
MAGDRHVASIADLMRSRARAASGTARIQGELAGQQGQIEAQRHLAKGQLYGGIAQGIGGSLRDLMQYRQQAPERELRANQAQLIARQSEALARELDAMDTAQAQQRIGQLAEVAMQTEDPAATDALFGAIGQLSPDYAPALESAKRDPALRMRLLETLKSQVPGYKPPGVIQRDPSKELRRDDTFEMIDPAQPTPPKTREITVRRPDGSTEIRLVTDEPGQTFESAAPQASAPEIGSFADFVKAQYGPRPTAAQIANARRTYADAARGPTTTDDLDRQLKELTLLERTSKMEAGQAEEARTAQTQERQRNSLLTQADSTLNELDRLLVKGADGEYRLAPSLSQIVGGSRLGGGLKRYVPGTPEADADVALDRVKSRLVVDLISEMKSQSATGATGFGQLSDKERLILESAAGRLSARQSDEALRDALVEIRTLTEKARNEAASGGAPIQPGTSRTIAPGGAPKPAADPLGLDF